MNVKFILFFLTVNISICIIDFIMNRKLVLDTQKVKSILEILERNPAWLARKIGITPSAVYYSMKTGSLVQINSIADVLNVDPKSLAITLVIKPPWKE